ncbi:hypothetical protein FIBSPDRAFT_935477 [Athelia psychrophila]|uniref:Homeodomain-like protein n=1 Tax=Athelia psychrophila TaxID=1759441 RepID=A0A166DQ30_9AGAM|nr:hypothetical protein FIBSPDRAFT_935477 [Fibularhizoctonia sp. CBS 109695]
MPGNRVHVSRERKERIVALADRHKTGEIAKICQVSPRTVLRVLKLWRTRGDVVRTPLHSGRPLQLGDLDLAYLEGCIERTPGVYLYELRAQLKNTRGMDVAETTIVRALERHGITYKSIIQEEQTAQ